MEKQLPVYFDLTGLLALEDLNLRTYAESQRISVAAYFALLDRFLAETVTTPEVLASFQSFEAEREAYRHLEEVATLLKELGCSKYLTDFFAILDAYEKGNRRLTAYLAEKAGLSFASFTRSLLVLRCDQPADLPDPTISLANYIAIRDAAERGTLPIILAVDDSPAILHSVSAVLSGEYKVYTLPKPKQLEAVLKRLTPDLFLLDYLMPERNGFELIPIIRSYPEHRETPIIFLTSEGTLDTVTAAHALGATDFAVKPFQPDTLREKVAKAIRRDPA